MSAGSYGVTGFAAAAVFFIGFAGNAGAQVSEQNECPLCDQANAMIERYNLEEGDTPARERPGWQRPVKIVVRPADAAEPIGPASEWVNSGKF